MLNCYGVWGLTKSKHKLNKDLSYKHKGKQLNHQVPFIQKWKEVGLLEEHIAALLMSTFDPKMFGFNTNSAPSN